MATPILLTSSRLFGNANSFEQNVVPFTPLTNLTARPISGAFPSTPQAALPTTGRSFVDGVFAVLQEGVRQVPRIIQATRNREVSPDTFQIVTGPAQQRVDRATGVKTSTVLLPSGVFSVRTSQPDDPDVAPQVRPSIIPGIPDIVLFIIGGLLLLGRS